MLWSEEQRDRLAQEEELIAQEYPSFWITDRILRGQTKIWGKHTTGSYNTYTLCVIINANYPYRMPSLYVTHPATLYDYWGKKLQSYGTSHKMHILSPNWNNYVRICHWKDEYWSASNTLNGVIMKGLTWLEAYDLHRKEGRYISHYLENFN